jgi:mono/diheme cytochrome c family protein
MAERKVSVGAIAGFAVLVALAAGWLVLRGRSAREEAAPETLSGSWEPARHLASSPSLLELGRELYAKQCSACHGPRGEGDGPAAYLLYPKPRNLVLASYRLVSTYDRVPTDEDLFGTISRGMPGSAMPSWVHLPEESRWALVHFVKSLAAEPLVIAAATPDDPEHGVIELAPEPAYTGEAKAEAAKLFVESCAPCHGLTGKGDGVQKQVDGEGFVTRPRDLTAGVFKGNPAPAHVFRRLVAGMPGTPMPSYVALPKEAIWHLVHYVRDLSSDDQRRRVEMERFEITAPRLGVLPTHPDDGLWRSAPRVNLHLMPLWWRGERPEELTVQAAHDGTRIAVLLTWSDATHDRTAMRPQDFRDAAAIQLSLTPDPPFFAMGGAGEFVNIWMWKSERQADLEPAFQDLEKIYPHIGIDSYPNLTLSPLEQPMRHALTLESDPTFVTAWGAGNIVADPERQSPAEDLVAQGLGTLQARPKVDQSVEARGIYATGTYRVLFSRSLKGNGGRAASMRPGRSVPAAFAVWNGSAGDRDGKKSVTIWQVLRLAP